MGDVFYFLLKILSGVGHLKVRNVPHPSGSPRILLIEEGPTLVSFVFTAERIALY